MEKPKILIVDDKLENLVALEKVLNVFDVDFIRSASGNEALVMTLMYDFALAIVDIQMPEMDGYETVELMRQEEKTKLLPVIFVSAIYTEDFHIVKGIETGAVDFIPKPIVPVILRGKVKVFLDLYIHKTQLEELVEKRTLDLKKINKKLKLEIGERKKANRQLEERNEELDAFSHTVAHDLKNPLGAIMGFAELLFDDYSELSKGVILKYINTILKSSNKMQQIINSLLLLASVRTQETQMEALDMNHIVTESLSRLTQMIEKSGAEIKLPDVWPIAVGYAPWIEEVWTNYLSNAIKYGGDPPHIEIGTDTGKSENVPEGMARFWVRDDGPGISTENQKLLFKQFERLEQAKTEGHGLGLSIVRRIIEKLGGEVGVENHRGSLFYFTLPYTNKTEKNAKIISKAIEVKKDKKSSKLKVLIAEDIESADKHLSIVIKKISEEILHAKTGIEAVEICRNNPDINLVLMDINMTEMDGHEATRKIREFNKDVIIIAQTAYALAGDREKAIEAGCDDYISKPIKRNELLGMIEKIFR